MLNFSEKESMQLINLMDQISNETPQLLENETKEFSKVFDELQKIEISLGNAPTDDEIGPIISKLNSLHTNLGTAQSEISPIDRPFSRTFESSTKNASWTMHQVRLQPRRQRKQRVS